MLVGTFNQEKALVGAFSVIVKTSCETDGSFHGTTGGVQERGIYHVSSILLQSLLRLYYQFWRPQVAGWQAAQQLQVHFKMSPASIIACWYYLLASETIHYFQFSSSKESDKCHLSIL